MSYSIHRIKEIIYEEKEQIDEKMNEAFDDIFEYGLSEHDGVIYIEDYDLDQLAKSEFLTDEQKEFWKMQREKSELNAEGGLYYEIF